MNDAPVSPLWGGLATARHRSPRLILHAIAIGRHSGAREPVVREGRQIGVLVVLIGELPADLVLHFGGVAAVVGEEVAAAAVGGGDFAGLQFGEVVGVEGLAVGPLEMVPEVINVDVAHLILIDIVLLLLLVVVQLIASLLIYLIHFFYIKNLNLKSDFMSFEVTIQ